MSELPPEAMKVYFEDESNLDPDRALICLRWLAATGLSASEAALGDQLGWDEERVDGAIAALQGRGEIEAPGPSEREIERIFEELRAEGQMEIAVDPETGKLKGRLTEDGLEEARKVIKRLGEELRDGE